LAIACLFRWAVALISCAALPARGVALSVHVAGSLRSHSYSIAASQALTPEFLILGVIWYIVFLFSTTCHEGAHSLAAKLGGDTTAFHGGQVTLNPIPHIKRGPFGLVVVPILSYFVAHWMIGWASAPYDPAWQQRYPRRAAWMALGGPAANFPLVLRSAVAIRAGIFFHVFAM